MFTFQRSIWKKTIFIYTVMVIKTLHCLNRNLYPCVRNSRRIENSFSYKGRCIWMVCCAVDSTKKPKKWINQQKRVIYEMHLQASARLRVAKSYNECVLIRRRGKGHDVKSLARQFNALAHERLLKHTDSEKISRKS